MTSYDAAGIGIVEKRDAVVVDVGIAPVESSPVVCIFGDAALRTGDEGEE